VINFLDKGIVNSAGMLEEAWAWGFDVDAWRAHLNPITWPEVTPTIIDCQHSIRMRCFAPAGEGGGVGVAPAPHQLTLGDPTRQFYASEKPIWKSAVWGPGEGKGSPTSTPRPKPNSCPDVTGCLVPCLLGARGGHKHCKHDHMAQRHMLAMHHRF